MLKKTQWTGFAALCFTGLLLTACGGGGGGSSAPIANNNEDGNVELPPPTASTTPLEGVWITDCDTSLLSDVRVSGHTIQTGHITYPDGDCVGSKSRFYLEGEFRVMGEKTLATGEQVKVKRALYTHYYAVGYDQRSVDELRKNYTHCAAPNSVFEEGQPIEIAACFAELTLPAAAEKIFFVNGERLHMNHEDDEDNSRLDYRFGYYYNKQ